MFKKQENIDFMIVGLGNPGTDYEHTLHNVGFDVIDLIAQDASVNYWKNECGALTAKCAIENKQVLLAKPQSFMNCSGGPVSELKKKYKLAGDAFVIVHDDLDLEPGSVRVKPKGSAGGHNGLKSIIEKLGTQEFLRVKVGIGHPPGQKPVVDWVLSKPIKANAEAHAEGIDAASKAALALLSNDIARVQNLYNH